MDLLITLTWKKLNSMLIRAISGKIWEKVLLGYANIDDYFKLREDELDAIINFFIEELEKK